MNNDRLDKIRELHKPRAQAGAEYFALELDVNEKGNVVWGTQTKWVGFASGTPRYELREATVVYPDRMRDLWHEMGERCMTVNDIHEFVLFLGLYILAMLSVQIRCTWSPYELTPKKCCTHYGNWIFQDFSEFPAKPLAHS